MAASDQCIMPELLLAFRGASTEEQMHSAPFRHLGWRKGSDESPDCCQFSETGLDPSRADFGLVLLFDSTHHQHGTDSGGSYL